MNSYLSLQSASPPADCELARASTLNSLSPTTDTHPPSHTPLRPVKATHKTNHHIYIQYNLPL